MYCIKCKAQLNPGAKFCPYCGTNQQPVSVQTAPVRPQPPRPAAQSAPVQPAPIPVVPPVPQVAPIQQGTPVPPASNPQANPIRRAAPIPPVSNPQAAPRTAAPAAQYAQAPVTAPDSVFDFSRMENQCPPDSESEVTSTTMTPPLRDAQRRNTRHISGKGIAGIISGAAVLAGRSCRSDDDTPRSNGEAEPDPGAGTPGFRALCGSSRPVRQGDFRRPRQRGSLQRQGGRPGRAGTPPGSRRYAPGGLQMYIEPSAQQQVR